MDPSLVRAMSEAGLFQMLVAEEFGGSEADLATYYRVLEEIAAADGSTGWNLMSGTQSSALVAGWLRPEIVTQVLGSDPYAVLGGSTDPSGARAVSVEGGYRLTGKWRFNTGIHHCDWLFSRAELWDSDGPRLDADGSKQGRFLLFRTADSRIVDTWSVSGMAGTDSQDNEVGDLFVPEEYTFDLFDQPPYSTLPLYRFPTVGFVAVCAAAVATGIAKGALEEFRRLANTKTATGTTARLSERPVVQTQYSEAEALLNAGRAYVLNVISEIWDLCLAEKPVTLEKKAQLRIACTNAARSAAAAVDLVYRASGTTAIFSSHPLGRHFRDINVLTQHYVLAPITYEAAGKVLLEAGAETGSP